jgi:hypothetical protein
VRTVKNYSCRINKIRIVIIKPGTKANNYSGCFHIIFSFVFSLVNSGNTFAAEMEKSNFVDQIRIFCRQRPWRQQGSKHFMRNKLTAMGGPDGGDGGRGAHIILKGNSQLWTLLHLRYFKNVLAEDGEDGSKNNSSRLTGKDIIIEVPLGTVARNEETGE